jgi:hypothetical protein
VNVVGGKQMISDGKWDIGGLMKMTPQYMFGQIFWAFVACAYAFNIVICYFLWANYKAVFRLRRRYLDSADYQASLSSRTLMVRSLDFEFR